MENVKRIPYGVSNFVEVMEQNQYYVDKTMYLPLLERQPDSLVLHTSASFRKKYLPEYAVGVLRYGPKRQIPKTFR